AAEACAALAQANLLDPEPFAHELGAHLSEGTVLAGRIADALADAASIGALSGYRVLQMLAVLPDLTGVRNPGALVTLTAAVPAVALTLAFLWIVRGEVVVPHPVSLVMLLLGLPVLAGLVFGAGGLHRLSAPVTTA
ncbi:MAG TPA: hypothetical protein PLS46_08915, partial [Microthrixaceae bacterium]|nr:hypothetical protein [Microthrixaceae bacterium]